MVMLALPPPVWAPMVVTYQLPQLSVGATVPPVVNHDGVAENAAAGAALVTAVTAAMVMAPTASATAIAAVLSVLSPRTLFRRPFIEPLSSVSSLYRNLVSTAAQPLLRRVRRASWAVARQLLIWSWNVSVAVWWVRLVASVTLT